MDKLANDQFGGFDATTTHVRMRGWFSALKLLPLILIALLVLLAGCASAPSKSKKAAYAPQHINNKTKFSSKDYGVAGSPRVTTSRKVKKGGGRYQVGKPYKIKGKWYRPKEQPNYRKIGMASWYGPNFHGRLTANGEIYDQYALTAAHPTLPLPSYARVTNMENGAQVTVRINDRGPFSNKRIIDLSARASELLGYQKQGLAKVKVEYVGKARMDGLDERYLVASYKPGRGQNQSPALRTLFAGGAKPRGNLLAALSPPSPNITSTTEIARKNLNEISADTPPLFAYNAPIPTQRPTPIHTGSVLNLSDNGTQALVVPTDFKRGTLAPLGFLREQRINRRVQQAFANFDLSDGYK